MNTERKNTVSDSELNSGRDMHIGDNRTIIYHNRGIIIVALTLIAALCILVCELMNKNQLGVDAGNEETDRDSIEHHLIIPVSDNHGSDTTRINPTIQENTLANTNNNAAPLISGRVLNENGQPLDQVLVMISGSPETIYTNTEGFFYVRADFPRPKGEYSLTISKPGYESMTHIYFEFPKTDIIERLTKIE